jgi:hypothetical protein
LDFRVMHRFGDMAGVNGGIKTFFGFDNAPDINIGFDYGLTSDLTIGISRSKGAGTWQQVYGGSLKYAWLNNSRFKITSVHESSVTAMKANDNVESSSNFTSFNNRLGFYNSILGSYHISSLLTAQLNAGLSHRNFVHYSEENTHLTSGVAFLFNITKVYSIVAEYQAIGTTSLNSAYMEGNVPVQSIVGLSLAVNTGGHIFKLDVVNGSNTDATQLLAFTNEKITEGRFRFGFTISRTFKK